MHIPRKIERVVNANIAPILSHLFISINYVIIKVKTTPTMLLTMCVIPIVAAGLIGWNSVAMNEFPIPIIGSIQKPYSPMQAVISKTFPKKRPPVTAKKLGIPVITMIKNCTR